MRARLQRRIPKFFSFSGIDGAGKSTQIVNLCAHMERLGLQVRVFQFWDDVATLTWLRESGSRTLFKGDSGVGTPATPINRRDKNVQSWPMTCVRLFTYLADAVATSIFVKRTLRSGADLLIFDRYVYDELANLKLRNPIARTYVRLIAALVPSPDIAFILDADPSEARARKPEYPLDFLNTSRQSYLGLSNLVGDMTVIPPMSESEVKSEIIRLATKAFPLEPSPLNASADTPQTRSSEVDTVAL
jgi:thymidylate kinase